MMLARTGVRIALAMLACLPAAYVFANPLGPLETTPPLHDTGLYWAPPVMSGTVLHDLGSGGYTNVPGEIGYGSNDWRWLSTHGYASFNLTAFPDSAFVVGARLRYSQYDGTDGTITSLVLLPTLNLSPQDLFQAISTGPEIDPARNTPNGPVLRQLNARGVIAVDSCIRSHSELCVGWKGGTALAGRAFGAESFRPERACLEVHFTTSQDFVDVSICNVTADSFPCQVGHPTPVTSKAVNFGNSPARAVTLCASIAGVVQDSVTVDSIMPSETTAVELTFPPTSQPGVTDLLVSCRAPADWCRHNDTARQNVFTFPANARHAEGFESPYCDSFPPVGWADISTNGWNRNAVWDPHRHAGQNYAVSSGESPCEDWLITPGLSPAVEAADTIGFFHGHGRSGVVPRFQVWVLGSQNPNDVLGLLLDTLRAGPWYEYHLSLDNYDGTTIFVGFRKFWNGTTKLDDIWFTCSLASGVQEVGDLPPVSDRGLALYPSIVRRGGQILVRATSPRRPQSISLSDATGRVVLRDTPCDECRDEVLCLKTDQLSTGVYFLVPEPRSSWLTVPMVIIP